MTVRSATSPSSVQHDLPVDHPAAHPTDTAARTTASPVARSASTFGGAQTNPNEILGRYTPTGASEKTARNQVGMHGGVAASQKMAQQDLARLQPHKADIESVAKQYGLPPALLAGIISRESRAGAALDSRGYGDRGRGYGLMQVDKGTAAGRGGPTSRENIEQGAGILKGKLNEVKAAHPNWTPDQQLRGAVAAYNMGAKNVQTVKGMDAGTTGDDYSNDVWARAQALAPHFGGTATPDTDHAPELNPSHHPADTGTHPEPSTVGATAAPRLDSSGHTVLNQGDSGQSVKDLQKSLKAAGFNPGEVDGQYGPKTEAAVKAFQQAHHLDVDGIAGPKTNGALNETTAQRPAPSGQTRWTPAPSLAEVQSGKATLKQGDQGAAVAELQRQLGVDADGKFGKDTAQAVSDFKKTQHLGGPAGEAGQGTLDALKKQNASGNTGVVAGNYQVDTNNPTLRKLATGNLETGPTGYCVATTLKNMGRLGVPHAAATGEDVGNNPRGGMVQMMKNYGWKSLPLPGSKLQTIKSPAYGTVQANVVPAAEYEKLAKAGKIPSGALIFQTRHDSWNSTSQGSHGFDMGIVRNGGRNTFNYANMPPLIYSGAKSVVILVPGNALKPAH